MSVLQESLTQMKTLTGMSCPAGLTRAVVFAFDRFGGSLGMCPKELVDTQL